MKSFLDRVHWTIPVYRMAPEAAAPYESGGIPATEIISKNGDVVLKSLGAQQWDTPDVAKSLQSLIDQ